MKEEIDCIFLNNDFQCILGKDTEECFTGICSDRRKLDKTEE